MYVLAKSGFSRRVSTRTGLAASAILLLGIWASFNWFITIHRITQLYVNLPTWDYWRVPSEVSEIQRFDPSFLWRQHNEHRIVFPDLVFALDVVFLHGCRILPIVLSFLCYLGSWAILACMISAEPGLSRATRACLVLLIGVLIGWKGCTPVLADPFLLQWTLMEVAVLASLAFLSRVNRGGGNRPLVGAILSGFIATYSSANGLLLWLVLLVAALLLRLTRKQIAILASSGLLADGFYFIGYKFSGNTSFLNLLLHPAYAICFVAVYLSMPFGGMKSPQFGVYVGLANLSLTMLLLLIAIRNGLLRTRLGIVLFGSYSFTLLTALLTASGRMDSSDLFFTGAKATRYVAPVIVNWAVFLTLAIWITAVRSWHKVLAPALIVASAVLLFISFLKLKWWLQTSTRAFVDEQVTELSVKNELSDPRLLRSIFPEPGFVESYLPLLKIAHLSIFYENEAKWLGKSISRFGPISSSESHGSITRMFPVISGIEIVGWAQGGERSSGFKRVLLANEQGMIIGLGRRLPDGLPSELFSPATPPKLAWIGFVPAKYASGSFSAYVIDPRSKELLPVQGHFKFPEITAVPRSDAGPSLTGLKWQLDRGWTLNGTGPHNLKQPAPPGLVYGSWNHSDSETGQLTSSNFDVPPSGCLIVPVLHGPSTHGLAVELLDSDRRQVIQTMPMQDEDVQWEYWRVPVPERTRRVQLLAQDEGKGPGQWLAIATPAKCD